MYEFIKFNLKARRIREGDFKFGVRPTIFKSSTTMEAVWEETEKYFYYGEMYIIVFYSF